MTLVPPARVIGIGETGDSWPRALIFDANVFLNLAKTPGNAPVLRAIKDNVAKGTSFRLLIPEPVMSAVQHHRENAIKDHWAIRREALRNMKAHLGDLASDPDQFKLFAEALHRTIEAQTAALPDTVSAMDELLSTGTVVKCHPSHFEDAGRRFVEKRAPAHLRQKKREHISIFNDCLIWAVVRDTATSQAVELVTADSDFTSPEHNERLHPELESELAGLKFKFHTLNAFVQKHISREVAVVSPPIFFGSLGTAYKQCPVCGSDQIRPDLIPGPSQYGGWSYRQFCPAHAGYVDTGEPYDD
ncbi:MAG TPA: PIN domain-containing protein [Polyangia bacterium]|jgi:predicted nucleic acid-binding protein